MNRGGISRMLAPDEELTGKAYLFIGLGLFAIKFAIDSVISLLMMHRPWSPWNYVAPGAAFGVPSAHANLSVVWTMLAVSIPFIVTGLMLTMRRLRSAGWPAWLVVIFFIPLLNFFFFLIIGLQPTRVVQAIPTAEAAPRPPAAPGSDAPLLNYGHDQVGPGSAFIGRFLPRNAGLSFFVSILLPAPVGLAILYLGINILGNYGWGVFVGLPFVMAMLSVLVHSFHRELLLRHCIGLAIVTMLVYAGSLLLLGVEGAGCIIMALPLVIPIAMVGALIGYLIQRARHVNATGVALALLLFLPLFMGAERAALPDAPLYAVTTVVEIDAPPSRVWKHVISFPDLPPPTETIFRLGVAHPQRARIEGRGVGACRYCIFSTGAFVEPITAWDEGKLLKFDVTENPPAMKEWSPYADIHPSHLENFLVSHAGQFRLIALENGRTRLEGTTWYQHHMWPEAYWRLWSDSILHTIHRRVLIHVKQLSEADHERDS